MENKDELKEIGIKNCMCYYFDGIIRFWYRNVSFCDILLDEKLYKEKCKNIIIDKTLLRSKFITNVFKCCFVSLVNFSYWSKFHINIITGSGVMTILF